jgi:formylglycine-generating enzyme required for sulfatase activity
MITGKSVGDMKLDGLRRRSDPLKEGRDRPRHPFEPNEKKKVQRGGSFLCNDQYCSRYIVGTGGKGEVYTGTNHLGFRCVKDAAAKTAGR